MFLKNNTVRIEESRYNQEFAFEAVEDSDNNVRLIKFTEKLIELVVEEINKRGPVYLETDKNEFPETGRTEIDLTTILVNDENIAYELFDLQGSVLGFWIYENTLSSDGFANDRFEIGLIVNYEQLLELCLAERREEVFPEQSCYDEDYFAAYCVTVAHEIAHILDSNMNLGTIMVPNEIENLSMDYGIEASSLYQGRETNPDVIAVLDKIYEDGACEYTELDKLMENRVEALGRDINDAIWPKVRSMPEFQKVMESLTSDINKDIYDTMTP